MDEQKQIYIGHRYVPKIVGEWDITKSYEGLTVVVNEGGSYTSKKAVPVGVALTNNEYWVITGNYNAQIENYREEVKQNSTDLSNYKQELLVKFQENASNFLKINKKLSGLIDLDVKDFGFKTSDEDPLFDNTPKLIDLINHINTVVGGNCNVTFLKGEYKFGKGVVPPIITNEVTFVGMGFDKTRFILNDSTYWTWGNESITTSGGGIEDITLQFRPDDTNLINPTVKAYNSTRQTYRIKYWIGCTFLEVGSASSKAYVQTIQNSSVLMANKGKPFVRLINGAGFTWNTFDYISHLEASTPPFASGVGYEMNTMPGTNVIDITGAWDTVELSIFAEKLYRVININNPSGVVYNIKDTGSIYDYIRDNAIHINLDTSGSVVSVFLCDTYINTWEGHGIYGYSNSKDLRWLSLSNVNMLYTGKAGIRLDGTGVSVRKFAINDSKIRGSGRLDGTSHAIELGKYLKDFNISDNNIGGADLASNITWGDDKGIIAINGIDMLWEDYIISNNNSKYTNLMIDNDFTPIQANVKEGIIKGNTGSVHSGFKTSSPFNLPISNETWFNVTPYDVEVFLGGINLTEIHKNGQVLPIKNGILTLKPKENFKIIYTDVTDLEVLFNILN